MKLKKRFSRPIQQTTVAMHIKQHSSLYLFVTILFLMGVIFGAIVVNSLSVTQKEDLFSYLSQFFGQISTEPTAGARDLFFQSLFDHVKLVFFIFVLGISVIGLPIIIGILFVKGLVVGFTVGFLVYQMNWKGLLLSFVSVLPQNIIVVPVIIVLAVMAISFSVRLVKRQFGKINQPIKPLFAAYTLTFVACLCLLVGAAAIEAFISPYFMKSIVNSMSI